MKKVDITKMNILRKRIDKIDERIIFLLSRRQRVVKEIGEIKKRNSVSPLDSKRWKEVVRSRIILAEKLELDSGLIKKLYNLIHKHSLLIEK